MKKTLYPKTSRVGLKQKIVITEKLDGSTLGIFKIGGELIIAQKNHIVPVSGLTKEIAYRGLIGWLESNKHTIDLHEGFGIFGERLGMGHIKYGESKSNKFYMFAKANIDEEYNVTNINYNHDDFAFPFESVEIPSCISKVKIIDILETISIEELDRLYDLYMGTSKLLYGEWYCCEGFIVVYNDKYVEKYIRHKRGKSTEHTA